MPLERRVAEIVEGGDLAKLFIGNTWVRYVRDVDFGAVPPREDPDGARYVVFLHPDVPTDCGTLYCLFPSRDNGKERVLSAQRYRGGVRCLGEHALTVYARARANARQVGTCVT